MSNSELLSLGLLGAACLFGGALLFRSWLQRRTWPPLVAAVLVLVVGASAIVLALLGAPYRQVVGPALIIAMLVILAAARIERRYR
jgi:peptidoglycan/LPS O-acetylase OafA/YrhL